MCLQYQWGLVAIEAAVLSAACAAHLFRLRRARSPVAGLFAVVTALCLVQVVVARVQQQVDSAFHTSPVMRKAMIPAHPAYPNALKVIAQLLKRADKPLGSNPGTDSQAIMRSMHATGSPQPLNK